MARLLKQRFETVNVDSLKPHPRNPNRGNVEVITESVEQNGFYGVILVQEGTNHVLAGNHRLQAAKRAGLTEVPVAFVDFSDSDALRVMLADNRTAEKAHRDEEALAELLAELNTADTLSGTGYSAADLEQLIREVAQEDAPPTAPDEFKSFDEDIETEYCCPKCGYEWSGKPR